MDGWFWVLTVVGGVIVGLLVRRLFMTPAAREFEELSRTCMQKQAMKRNGKVKGTRGAPNLTIPLKTVDLDLAFMRNDNDLLREHTYARFKTEHFLDKKIKIQANSADFLLKPLVIGTRVEGLDEKFSEKYIVTGNDGSFVKDLLTEEIRDKLLEKRVHVKFGRRTDSSKLSTERGWLTVFIQGLQADDETFDGLIETAILFYERLETLRFRAN